MDEIMGMIVLILGIFFSVGIDFGSDLNKDSYEKYFYGL